VIALGSTGAGARLDHLAEFHRRTIVTRAGDGPTCVHAGDEN